MVLLGFQNLIIFFFVTSGVPGVGGAHIGPQFVVHHLILLIVVVPVEHLLDTLPPQQLPTLYHPLVVQVLPLAVAVRHVVVVLLWGHEGSP